MPATVSHVLSATTPDNTSYEIRPSHWNSAHAITFNAAGSEISGAFSNLNGISFGMNGTALTASHNALTTGAASNHSHGFSAAGGSSAFQTLSFSNTNGVSFSNSNGQVVASVATTYAASNHSHGDPTLFLTNISGTTASNSAGLTLSLSVGAGGAGDGVNILAAGTRTATISGTVMMSNSNGISFGLNGVNGSIMTASHNGLTTAAASDHSHGNPTLNLTNLSGTTGSNSAGFTLSLSAAAPAVGVAVSAAGASVSNGTAVWSNSNGVSFGMNGSTVTASHNGLTSQSNQQITAGNGGFTFQTLSFSNLNGISFGTSAGSAITASHNGLTTAAASNHSHGNPTLALTNISGTTASASNGLTLSLSVDATTSISATGAVSLSANGSTLSIGVPQFSFYASSNTTAQSSSSSFSHGSLTFRGAGGVSVGFSGSEVVISGGAGAAPAASAANGSFTFNTMSFSNLNGISFGTSAGSAITASHNGLTTARASTDAIGLNTANTNVTWTVNSSGLSINAGGYAGTATGFTGANISGTFTHNSVGLSMSLSVAAPGAAAEANAHNLLGNNTAGNTTASGSTIGLSGINLTLSGTNGSIINISAPATSSLVGASGLSVSTNGSTISVGQILGSYYDNFGGMWPNSTTLTVAQSTSHVLPFMLQEPISFAFIRMPMTASLIGASTTAATTGNSQFSYGLSKSHNFVFYSRGTGASSMSLMSVASTQVTEQQSINVSANANSTQFSYTNRATYPMSSGPVGFTFDYSSSAASLNFHTSNMTAITGIKMMDFAWGTSLSAGQYWLVYGMSSNSASQYTSPATQLFNRFTNYGMSQVNLAFGTIGAASNSSVGPLFGLGSFTTAGGGTTANLPISAVSTSGSHNQIMFQIAGF